MVGRRKMNAGGCIGSQNYIEIDKVDAIRDADKRDFTNPETLTDTDNLIDEEIFISHMTENNYLPVFIEQDRFSKPATNKNITIILQRAKELGKTPCIILGNESFGIPANIIKTRTQFDLTYTLELMQMGPVRSHNVGVCGGIICYKVMECFAEL